SWCLMRGVNGTGREIQKIGLLRCERLVGMKPADGIIGQVCRQVVSLLRSRRRWYGTGVTVKTGRFPLVLPATHEAVEVVKSKVGGPMIERSQGTHFPGGSVVPLAEGG